MSDPLSITLAAVTLATALKDIIELGEKIHRSFAKVSQNLRNAQKLAHETYQTLHELTEFCAKNKGILDLIPEVRVALVSLRRKLAEVYSHTVQLIPPSSEKYIGHLKVAIYSWRHGTKIEAEISGLKKSVEDCYLKTAMFASLRTEVRVSEFQKSNCEQLHTILNAVLDLRVSDTRIGYFGGSQATILKSPVMDENIALDNYLKVQIHIVTRIMTRFPFEQLVFPPPNSTLPEIHTTSPTPFSSTIDRYMARDKSSLHQGAVRHIFEIQDLFQSSIVPTTLELGIYLTQQLAAQLSALGMVEEAAHIGTWMVRLCRALAPHDAQSYDHHLVHYLSLLSGFHCDSGNIDAAHHSIAECVSLSLQLQTVSASAETRLQHADALAELASVLHFLEDFERSFDIMKEAVRTFEEALQISDGWQNRRMDGIDAYLHQYARALHHLSIGLQRRGSITESFEAEIKAISILRDVVILNPDSSADLDIAVTLLHLTFKEFSPMLSLDRRLIYAEQCLAIYHKYLDLNPTHFGRHFCDALRRKGLILWQIGRCEEALEAFNKSAKLATKLVDSQSYISRILKTASRYITKMRRRADIQAEGRKEAVAFYEYRR